MLVSRDDPDWFDVRTADGQLTGAVPALYMRFGEGTSRPAGTEEEDFDKAIAKVYAPLHEP